MVQFNYKPLLKNSCTQVKTQNSKDDFINKNCERDSCICIFLKAQPTPEWIMKNIEKTQKEGSWKNEPKLLSNNDIKNTDKLDELQILKSCCRKNSICRFLQTQPVPEWTKSVQHNYNNIINKALDYQKEHMLQRPLDLHTDPIRIQEAISVPQNCETTKSTRGSLSQQPLELHPSSCYHQKYFSNIIQQSLELDNDSSHLQKSSSSPHEQSKTSKPILEGSLPQQSLKSYIDANHIEKTPQGFETSESRRGSLLQQEFELHTNPSFHQKFGRRRCKTRKSTGSSLPRQLTAHEDPNRTQESPSAVHTYDTPNNKLCIQSSVKDSNNYSFFPNNAYAFIQSVRVKQCPNPSCTQKIPSQVHKHEANNNKITQSGVEDVKNYNIFPNNTYAFIQSARAKNYRKLTTNQPLQCRCSCHCNSRISEIN